MNERLLGDRPVSHPKDDAFGFSSFADALATSLLKMSPDDGLVISIEAPWGAGKSSAIALTVRTIKIRVLRELGEDKSEIEKLNEVELDAWWKEKDSLRKTHVVRFNPWNFSGQENLVRAFFKELAAQVNVEPEGTLKRAMNQIASYLPSVAGGLAVIGALAAGNVSAAAATGTAGRAVGEVAGQAFRSENSLESAKKNLSNALQDSGQRIIVIIDDLDRLTPSEMRAVFSLVKSLGDLPNVLYVLSFDNDIVHNALGESVESFDSSFLEKIVQVSLKLPPPWRSELREHFFARLNSIIGDAKPADEGRWQNMFFGGIDQYLETPRDVTRLANTLQVIWPNVEGDIDLTDLIALTTFQLFDPDVYTLIRDEIEIITYANYKYEDDQDFGKRMTPKGRKPDVAKDMMAFMFPRLAKAWANFASDGTSYITQKNHRRICTKEYHRNYFVFGRDARMFSRAEVDAIVTATDPSSILSDTLERLKGGQTDGRPSRVVSLLEQIGETVHANACLTPPLLQALLDQSDDLIRRDDPVWEFFVTHNIDRLETVISLGTQKLDEDKRTTILGVLVNHKTGLQIRAEIVENDARCHGLYGGDQRDDRKRLFLLNEIRSAAEAIRTQIISACIEGRVWNSPNPARLIWVWARMDGGENLTNWLKSIVENDMLVIKLANELPGRSYQSDSHGSRVVLTFRRSSWETLFDVDHLFSRLETLASTDSQAASALTRLREAEQAGKS